MINIDLYNATDEIKYTAFNVDGNEAEALNDSYLELYEIVGKDAMLKIYKCFRGNKIECPMKLYRSQYVADLVKNESGKRERARIARAGGYTIKFIESIIRKGT